MWGADEGGRGGRGGFRAAGVGRSCGDEVSAGRSWESQRGHSEPARHTSALVRAAGKEGEWIRGGSCGGRGGSAGTGLERFRRERLAEYSGASATWAAERVDAEVLEDARRDADVEVGGGERRGAEVASAGIEL